MHGKTLQNCLFDRAPSGELLVMPRTEAKHVLSVFVVVVVRIVICRKGNSFALYILLMVPLRRVG